MYSHIQANKLPDPCTYPDNTANAVINAYLRAVYIHFVGGHKILLDNDSEFRNKLFSEVASQPGKKSTNSHHLISQTLNGKLSSHTHS